MKERPILFSAPMVNAILQGRKSQTRRTLYTLQKYRPGLAIDRRYPEPRGVSASGFPDTPVGYAWGLNHWRTVTVGQRLWVRETWRAKPYSLDRQHPEVEYRASMKYEGTTPNGKALDALIEKRAPWNPSIHMPRWASRITLEVTGVRVERLQSISCADAIAEGCAAVSLYNLDCDSPDPRDEYRALWGSINGADSWAANPWVWAIEFQRVTA